jgi:hypothetical protein
MGFATLCLTSLISYAFGARGIVFLGSVIIGFFPIAMVWSTIARRLLPPTLIFSDEYLTDIKNRR